MNNDAPFTTTTPFLQGFAAPPLLVGTIYHLVLTEADCKELGTIDAPGLLEIFRNMKKRIEVLERDYATAQKEIEWLRSFTVVEDKDLF